MIDLDFKIINHNFMINEKCEISTIVKIIGHQSKRIEQILKTGSFFNIHKCKEQRQPIFG
jgi:hypothetical protein